MAHAFARYADSVRDQGDVPKALGLWRQAIDLAPDGPDARAAQARVALWDAAQALERGHADVAGFRRALALDPSLSEAKKGLSRAEWMQTRRRWLHVAEGVVAAFALAFALWLLWRRTAPPATA
jgi:hypothetical protein